MCLGGGAPAPPQVVKRPDPEPGPASPQDMVNNQAVSNANSRADQQAARDANRGTTASKQSSKIDKAY
tara:strand:+ start:1253 stop:1456 length:204 start_codon:yes stop_codon:yes gene_type:complete